MLIGRNALYYDDYVLSIQYFNEVINAKPYLYEPYYFRAVAKLYLEDYSGAESDCSEAIKLNPFIEDAYQLRGLCRIKGGKFEEAIEDYTQVIEYKPLDQVKPGFILLQKLIAALHQIVNALPADSLLLGHLA